MRYPQFKIFYNYIIKMSCSNKLRPFVFMDCLDNKSPLFTGGFLCLFVLTKYKFPRLLTHYLYSCHSEIIFILSFATQPYI